MFTSSIFSLPASGCSHWRPSVGDPGIPPKPRLAVGATPRTPLGQPDADRGLSGQRALPWPRPGKGPASTVPSALVPWGSPCGPARTARRCPRAVPGEVVTCSPNLSLAPCFEGYAPPTTTESRLGLLPAPGPSSSLCLPRQLRARRCQGTNPGNTLGASPAPNRGQPARGRSGYRSRLAGWEGAPETTAKCHQDSE